MAEVNDIMIKFQQYLGYICLHFQPLSWFMDTHNNFFNFIATIYN